MKAHERLVRPFTATAIAAALLAAVLAFAALSCGRGNLQVAHQADGLEIHQPEGLTAVPTTSAVTQLKELPCPEGVDTTLWDELRDALKEALACRAATCGPPLVEATEGLDGGARVPALQKTASTPPTGDINRVNDLSMADNDDGSYTLSWHYRNLGDYGQDGTVGISDITPIAQHFGETYDPETEPNSIQAVVDGSGNGKVDIADVTAIAQNYGNECAAYSIRRSSSYPEGIGDTTELDTAPVEPEQWVERRLFSRDFSLPPYTYIAVAPVDAEGTPGELSNVRYTTNHQPVAALVADPTEGDAPLTVNFDASESHDPDGPIAKYEWDWEGDGVWDEDTGAAPVAQHVYEIADYYYPIVRVTDGSGATATAEAELHAGQWRIVVVSDEISSEPESTNLEVVNGHPAISFYGMIGSAVDGFWYVRAEDPLGEAWGSPVFVIKAYAESGHMGDNSLAVVNGRPAIAGLDASGSRLYYARANDADGDTWGAPLEVCMAGQRENNVSLAIVDGRPAVAFYYGHLNYARALDANGTAWGIRVEVNSEGSEPSLATVNGNPAISYTAADGLWYVRANDAGGETWGAPVIADPLNGYTYVWRDSLAVVNGHPAISYQARVDDETNSYHIRFARADDPNGDAWGTPLTVDGEMGLKRWSTSLRVINGRPAIAYDAVPPDSVVYEVRFVRAKDANGSAWGEPVVLDSGNHCSLGQINGCPAVSYLSYGELKFAFYQ